MENEGGEEMLPIETLEKHPEMFIEFIKDKTLNENNELIQIKDIEQKRVEWLKREFENKR